MTELRKHCTIGEKQFDICINRNLALDGLKKFPRYWEIIQKSKDSDFDNDGLSDIANLEKLLVVSDEISEISPKLVAYMLPKMLNLANDMSNAQQIIKYVVDNDAEDVFYTKTIEFIMLGFMNGKATKKPKIKVVMD